jgi:phage regulator Rha-like protein
VYIRKGECKVEIINVGKNVVVTSRDIKDWTGKRHTDVLRDIDNEIDQLGDEIGRRIFASGSYLDVQNQERRQYTMGKEGVMQLLTRYDAKVRYACIKKIEELERMINTPRIKTRRQLAEENLTLIIELEEKDKIIELKTEENEELTVALNINTKYYTVARYNREFNKGWTLEQCQKVGKTLTAYCRTRRIEVRKCKTNDERFGIVNSYHEDVWKAFDT